ncbi:MAG: hypothetical protein GY791_03855 [Alphaproteobacteria bacterium]|nr:hypothetical protein [Alphaproteobacteria bacterium]
MQTKTRVPSPEEHAKAVLRMRDEFAKCLNEARNAGRHIEVKGLLAELRKVDKLIADYGLTRYA